MINQEIYHKIREYIVLRLTRELAPDLYYHCVQHTLDVEEQAVRIADNESVTKESDLLLLKIACLFHDCGFMVGYSDHEIAGCEIIRDTLPAFGLNADEIKNVCGMVMATKIPQTPHNLLEKIICDADLDYLGREDFEPISDDLYRELKGRGIVSDRNAWDVIQVGFFKQHHYFTSISLSNRAAVKAIHLKKIEERLILK